MIVLDGVTYDLVVQRDGFDWIVADPDGLIFSRQETRRAAERALAAREDRMIGQGGRRIGRETQETQKTLNGTR
jgi:regulator of RNase E activity RraA